MLPIFKFTFYKPNGKKSEPPHFVYITDNNVKIVSVVLYRQLARHTFFIHVFLNLHAPAVLVFSTSTSFSASK